MKKDIILAGVGGQGILSIATIIGYAVVESGLYLKQAEVHGMSQRGGDVQSNLRFSDKPINSDLIPNGEADIIISVEPMEALRYLPFLSEDGWVITNTNPYINIPDYPTEDQLKAELEKLPNKIALNADDVAKEAGNVRAMNMVMLGATSPFLGLPVEKLEEGIKAVFSRKGEAVVELNLKAFNIGRKFAEENK
jgi:indolepyruvate ferredoxin oxidoreductase beta subunit